MAQWWMRHLGDWPRSEMNCHRAEAVPVAMKPCPLCKSIANTDDSGCRADAGPKGVSLGDGATSTYLLSGPEERLARGGGPWTWQWS